MTEMTSEFLMEYFRVCILYGRTVTVVEIYIRRRNILIRHSVIFQDGTPHLHERYNLNNLSTFLFVSSLQILTEKKKLSSDWSNKIMEAPEPES